jgi:hypothetical protein
MIADSAVPMADARKANWSRLMAYLPFGWNVAAAAAEITCG